jgi:hypothetical protein
LSKRKPKRNWCFVSASERPFAGGRWSTNTYEQFVRRVLRQGWLLYPVRRDVLLSARRPYRGKNPRKKWEYKCAACEKYFKEKKVQVDHIKECIDTDTIAQFIARLFCEEENLQVLCNSCHDAKTLAYKLRRKGKKDAYRSRIGSGKTT